MMRFIVFTSCVVISCLAQLSSAADVKGSLNVVIIYADDLGYGDLGCYGHKKFKTPHLDQMAANGVRLTNFYSSCSYCAPSRASLMTGRYPFRCGMFRNPHPKADYGVRGRSSSDEIGLPPEEITLGEVFQSAGYRTACFGKWHLGHKPRYLPTRNGFDEYLGILYSNDMHPVELFENEKIIEFPVVQKTLTKRYAERAVKFIEENKERPFFLYLPHAMPHKPLAVSEAFYKKSGAGLYGDVIAELDWAVGEVLEKLRQEKLDRHTLVLFTSDNGPWFGGSTGGLRGMKSLCWEGGLRVPMIAQLPGVIPAGQVCHQQAIIMDLFNTSLAAAGVKPPQDRNLDGKDIMPLLTGKGKSPHKALFSFQSRLRSVRVGKWKLHVGGTPGDHGFKSDWVDPRRPNGKTILAQAEQPRPSAYPGIRTGDNSKEPALFDLEADPAEQHNVAAKHPEVVERLSKLIAEMQTVHAEAKKKYGAN